MSQNNGDNDDKNKMNIEKIWAAVEQGPKPGFNVPDYPEWEMKAYYEKSCAARATIAATVGLGIGFLYGMGDLTWNRPDGFLYEHKGVKVVDTVRLNNYFGWTGRYLLRPMAMAAIVSTTFSAVECLVESIRGVPGQESPYWNATAGGLVSGALMALFKGHRRLDLITVTSLAVAGAMGSCGFAQHAESQPQVEYRQRMNNANTVTVASLKKLYPEYKDI